MTLATEVDLVKNACVASGLFMRADCNVNVAVDSSSGFAAPPEPVKTAPVARRAWGDKIFGAIAQSKIAEENTSCLQPPSARQVERPGAHQICLHRNFHQQRRLAQTERDAAVFRE